ncbi:MAG: prepilin-type N-terminal cleavage/methylation domain-containing protein [Phycisphaeraceae bacterium]
MRTLMRERVGRSGFTLLEVMIASTVLALITLALTQAMAAGHMHTLAALERARAMTLVEAMLEEVSVLGYPADPDAVVAPPATRSLITDLKAYDGLTEEPGALVDHVGVLLPDAYQGYTRTVTILENTTLAVADLGMTLSGLNVLVTVSLGDGRSWSAGRFVPDPDGGI